MTLRDAERAVEAAHRAEIRYVDSLPERPSKAQTEKAWKLIAATNEARARLRAMYLVLPSP